jgi:hypothetical protein
MTTKVLNTPAPTPQDDADVAALQTAAGEHLVDEIVGSLIEYNGRWQFAKGPALDSDAEYLVDVRSFTVAWKRWQSDKITAAIGPGRPIDGFVLPDRTQLPDQDENEWEYAKKGTKKKDPWVKQFSIVIKKISDDSIYTWRPSYDGRRAIRAIINFYASGHANHPGQMPVVRLGLHQQKPALMPTGEWREFGDDASPPGSPNLAPKIDLSSIGKSNKDAKEFGKAGNGGDPDDEIPF